MLAHPAGDRKSKRARKGRAPVKVSADDTIHDLKLKIVQTLNVHPQNALVHLFRQNQWQPVSDDKCSLAGKHHDQHKDSCIGLPCNTSVLYNCCSLASS